ncbi:MAG: hypothetical protein AMK70_04495 [Nitrospira bacterium SG8_35_1]|nr:MAG: hypothetical protein AMK70_04495 [Nitrospira bacterium SG8_35_1]
MEPIVSDAFTVEAKDCLCSISPAFWMVSVLAPSIFSPVNTSKALLCSGSLAIAALLPLCRLLIKAFA